MTLIVIITGVVLAIAVVSYAMAIMSVEVTDE